jgi:hypothetical protein
LSIAFAGGNNLSIKSIKDSDEASFITIEQEHRKVIIEELTGNYETFVDGKVMEQGRVDPLYQSDLTNLIIERIESTGECDLTSFSQSKILHVPFIENLLKHFQKATKTETKLLPIT